MKFNCNGFCALLLVSLLGMPGHSSPLIQRRPVLKEHLVPEGERPDLSVDFKSCALLKVVSRKNTYHMDDIMSLDIALMNTSSKPIFVPKNLAGGGLELEATDRNGRAVAIQRYTTILEAYTPSSYLKLNPGQYIVGHFSLLIGRTAQSAKLNKFLLEANQLDGTDRGKRIFDDNLFVDRGDAYLDCSNPESYSITASYQNEFVLVSPDQDRTKTAVGTLTAAPLTISVT